MRGLILLAALTSLVGCAVASFRPASAADSLRASAADNRHQLHLTLLQRQIAVERNSALQDAVKSGVEIKRSFYRWGGSCITVIT